LKDKRPGIVSCWFSNSLCFVSREKQEKVEDIKRNIKEGILVSYFIDRYSFHKTAALGSLCRKCDHVIITRLQIFAVRSVFGTGHMCVYHVSILFKTTFSVSMRLKSCVAAKYTRLGSVKRSSLHSSQTFQVGLWFYFIKVKAIQIITLEVTLVISGLAWRSKSCRRKETLLLLFYIDYSPNLGCFPIPCLRFTLFLNIQEF